MKEDEEKGHLLTQSNLISLFKVQMCSNVRAREEEPSKEVALNLRKETCEADGRDSGLINPRHG